MNGRASEACILRIAPPRDEAPPEAAAIAELSEKQS